MLRGLTGILSGLAASRAPRDGGSAATSGPATPSAADMRALRRLGESIGGDHETYCGSCDQFKPDCRYTEHWDEEHPASGPRWMPTCADCRQGITHAIDCDMDADCRCHVAAARMGDPRS
jgi:hypothetical protein